MKKTHLAALIAGLILSTQVRATDLMQAYSDAQSYDSQFASARAARAAGAEKSEQGRALLLPAVSASANARRINRGDLEFTSNAYQIDLRQPLYAPASFEQLEQSKLQVTITETQFAQARQELIVRLAQAYFDVLAAQDATMFIQTQKIAIAEQLESAKRNFEVGTATITDTHEAQSRFDLALAQEIAAQNDLEVKRNALAQITGKLPAELAGLKQGVKLEPPQPAQADSWVASAEQHNFAVTAQRLVAEIARRDITRNRAGHLPTADLTASYGRSSPFPGAIPITTTSTVGVQFNLPLFSGYAVTSRVRESIALEDKARADLDTARRNAAQGARSAYLGVQSGLSQVRALEAAEISSNSSLESNRLGYQVGVRINIDVLNAQQQLYSTRRDLAKARYDTLVNSLKLKAAAGNLTDPDVAQLNAFLQSR